MIFKNLTHQDIWIMHHCERCYFGSRGCSIIDKVVQSSDPRKPVEWERNPRKNVLMQDTIKCHMETRTPPKVGYTGPVVNDDVPMFNVTTPVDMDGNHA